MEQNFESIEISCECGDNHILNAMCVEQNSVKKLINYISEQNYKQLRIFIDPELYQNKKIKNIINEIRDIRIVIIQEKFSVNFAQEIVACNIDYKGEDYVIVIGDYKAVDVIKYYCKSTGLEVGVVVTGSFADFTFSKYARLYDGISYCFYNTTAPNFVVFFDEFFSEGILKLKSYLFLKSVAYFENILLGYNNHNEFCKKINAKILKAIRLSKKLQSKANAFMLCVFLGRAMSFFGGTKNFFGSEIDVCGVLEAKTKRDFFECYIMSSEIIIEVYKTALNTKLKILNFDLNVRLDNIKRIMRLSAICCLSFTKKQISISELQKRTRIVHSLKYMLIDLLDGKSLNFATDISKKDLIEGLYIAPEFSSKYKFLNLLRDLGYLENLLN